MKPRFVIPDYESRRRSIVPDYPFCEYAYEGKGCVRGTFCNHPDHPNAKQLSALCSATNCPKFKKHDISKQSEVET
jgi:hypothetical protein